MSYQGYGSQSKEAERQRQLAQAIAPNIGQPVAGIGGGLAQLAQALMTRKANKKADGLEEAHRARMAEALSGATAGLSPDAQAFAQAFPELFAQSQAKNMFPDLAKKAALDYQKGRDAVGDARHEKMFDYQMGRDVIGDKIRSDETTYNRGRDAAGDNFRNTQFTYQQGQDQISNQLRGRQVDATVAKAAKTDLGKTPIYLRGPDGNVSIGQLGSGQIVPAQVADGMTVIDPQQKSQMQQMGRSQGKIQGETLQNLPVVETNAARALKTVDHLLNHEGIDAGTGLSAKIPALPGTDKYAFNVANKQAQGQVFLQAYEALKGGGVITEIEGLKGEQALARMNTAQSRADYEAALNDYKVVIQNGLEAARRKAGTQSQGNQTFVYNPATGGFD